LSLQADVLKAF